MHASSTSIEEAHERKRTDSLVYDIARFVGSPFSFEVIGYENIQSPGPAIYVSNHLGSLGPLEVILSVPVRFYPWIISEMTNFKQAPRYLFDDFVHPVLHLGGGFGMLVSTLLTKISVRLFKAIHAVSIDRFGGWSPDGFRQSLRLLQECKNLLIFPEDALLPLDPETSMRHFMPGFVTLCNMYQTATEELLPIYPVAVQASSETVAIGKPEFFRSTGNHKQAISSFTQLVEERVRQMYLELKSGAENDLG